MRLPRKYALYKGEELLAMGTVRQIAEQTGVKPSSIYYYGTKAYVRRTDDRKSRRLVCLEGG